MQAEESVEPSNHSESLRWFYRAAINAGMPVAVWRLPHENRPHAIVDLSGNAVAQPLDLQRDHQGFVIAPFVNSGGEVSYFLSADVEWREGKLTYAISSLTERATLENQTRFSTTLAHLQSSTNGHSAALWHIPSQSKARASANEGDFNRMVADAVNSIKQLAFKKVVLSQALERKLRADFDPVSLFYRLCDAFPGAFISLVALPDIGTWVGATPELHVTFNEKHLRTVALAGTMPASELDAKWGAKEMEEQAIVSEYIRGCFQRHNIMKVDERGPETVRVGDLLHLQTTFAVKLETPGDAAAVNRLLPELHPTPAVCGLPKETALQYILRTESHDREFYSGFLGPVNYDGHSHLFVNLRCLQLLRSSAMLYAGVGITRDSVPEKEWLETQLKFDALLRFLDRSERNRSAVPLSSAPEFMEDVHRR